MDLIELTPIADTMVGLPGSGLSVEQRKRLTIAVELVSNPSIVFADEPTSGGLHGTALRVACSCHRTHRDGFPALPAACKPRLQSCPATTSAGLDARGAGLVMRAIKATVNTGRTVVCTM